jgi:hypothetical protein
MKPVNSKSLFSFICDQMEKLDKDEITIEQAKAQTNLAKQSNNILKYELDRTNTEMKVREFNLRTGANLEIRNAESKPFDDTVKK